MGRASEGPLSTHRDPTLARGNDGRTLPFPASWKAGLGRTPAVLRRLKGAARILAAKSRGQWSATMQHRCRAFELLILVTTPRLHDSRALVVRRQVTPDG